MRDAFDFAFARQCYASRPLSVGVFAVLLFHGTLGRAQEPAPAAQPRTFAEFLAMLPDDQVLNLGGAAQEGSSASETGQIDAGDGSVGEGFTEFDFGLDDGRDDLGVMDAESSRARSQADQDPESIPPGSAERADDANGNADQDRVLSLADVVASVYRSYPEIAAARQQLTVAGGELLSAYGAYDTKLQTFSLNEPTGFYENYRYGLGLARQTWWGGYVAAGYRNGRGFFQPWYKERQTDESGELKVAYNQPLLQGLAIDPQRVAVFQASLEQASAAPIIQQAILMISRDAVLQYWDWVLAGEILEAQRELLELAEERGRQFDDLLEAGTLARIDITINNALIAERRAKYFETLQKFQASSLKLGLFLRNTQGQPMPPDPTWLPDEFPIIDTPSDRTLQEDLAAALLRRPEPQLLQLDIRQIQWDRRLACNELLPRLDFVSELSQDFGSQASRSTDDKGQLELVIGVQGEVPIQRRKARGKIRSTTGKISQTNQKLRLVRDKIANDLFVAFNNLQLSDEAVQQYEASFEANLVALERFRFAFRQGQEDLITLNLLETKTTEVEIKLVEAQRAWFVALTEMQTALGLDPLEQAMIVANLPPSERPGPGNLPDIELPDEVELNEDFRLMLGGNAGDDEDDELDVDGEEDDVADDDDDGDE